MTESIEETIKRASVLTFALYTRTQDFATSSQSITNLVQLSCVVKRVVSGILVVGCKLMQQPDSFQMIRIHYYSGPIPPHPKRQKKKTLTRLNADSSSIRFPVPTIATRFATEGREPRHFHRRVKEDFFSFRSGEPDEQQKEEQKSSFSLSNFNNSYFNQNTLKIVSEARNTVNGVLREGFEASSSINRALRTGFLISPEIISAKQTIYDGSRSGKHARKTRSKLTDSSRAQQVIDPNYQSPLLQAPYKHDRRSKDELLPADGTHSQLHRFYSPSSEEGLPIQPEGTKGHPPPPPNIDKTQSYIWKIPGVTAAASLPSMLYRAVPYDQITSYSNINLDNVEKIAQLSGKIVSDRIRYRSKQEDQEKKQMAQTIQKLEQSNYENSRMPVYETTIAETAKINGNIDNDYYSFDYPAIMIAKKLSQMFRFPNLLEMVQRSFTTSSSYITEAIRVVPQKIAVLPLSSSGRIDDKTPSSDESHSSSSFVSILNGTIAKGITSAAMIPLVSTHIRDSTGAVSSLTTISANNVPLHGKRRVITPQTNVEAEKRRMIMMPANSASSSTYEAFLDSINGKDDNKSSHPRFNTPKYDHDDVNNHSKVRYRIEDEELELKDLKRKIEQILNEELRKYGFQI